VSLDVDMKPCARCGKPVKRSRRKRYCSEACSELAHRPGPRRFCYADPPYPGQAYLYRDHPDFAGEVDHQELVARLDREFPDGYVLSTASEALLPVWALVPRARLCVWNKPFTPLNGASVQHTFEPVLLVGGRPRPRERGFVRDVLTAPAVRHVEAEGVIGMKPPVFSRWIFDMLGALPGDEFVDLFPGSGGVAAEWARFEAAPVFEHEPVEALELELT
jgi:hypothetical protein